MILSGNPHKPTHTYTLVVKPAIHIIVHKFIYNIWLNNTLLKKDNCRLGQHHLFSWIFGSSSTSRYKHIFFKARHEVFQFRTCGNPRFCQITRRQLKVELDIVENLLISSGHIFSYWDPWDWYIYLHQSHGSHGFCKINTTSGIGHSGLCEVYLQQRSSKIESLVQWVVIEYLYRFKYGTIYLNHDILGSFPPKQNKLHKLTPLFVHLSKYSPLTGCEKHPQNDDVWWLKRIPGGAIHPFIKSSIIIHKRTSGPYKWPSKQVTGVISPYLEKLWATT